MKTETINRRNSKANVRENLRACAAKLDNVGLEYDDMKYFFDAIISIRDEMEALVSADNLPLTTMRKRCKALLREMEEIEWSVCDEGMYGFRDYFEEVVSYLEQFTKQKLKRVE